MLPSAVRELSMLPRAGEGGFLRLRVGECRIIYQVDDGGHSVLEAKIGRRGGVCRKK